MGGYRKSCESLRTFVGIYPIRNAALKKSTMHPAGSAVIGIDYVGHFMRILLVMLVLGAASSSEVVGEP